MADDEKKEDEKEEEKSEEKKEEKQEAKDEQFTIKVDGKERTVTKVELINLAQKADGADAKFREASEMRDNAQHGARIGSLFTSAKDGGLTTKEASELGGLIGLDTADMEKFMANEDKDKNKDDKPAEPEKKVVLTDMPEEVQKAVKASQTAEYEKAVVIITEDCKNVVDKDKILVKLIGDSSTADEVPSKMAAAAGMVFDDVQRRIYSGEQYGPDLVASSLQAIRANLQKFGTPAKASEQPNLPLILGLPQSPVLAKEVLSDDPIKRIEVSGDHYEDNFLQRFQQKVYSEAKKLNRHG